MTTYLLFDDARYRLDEIFDYTLAAWGEAQAIRYFDGFRERFDAIAARTIRWCPIPEALTASGYFCRYEHHFIYWRVLEDGAVGIVTILHERMQRIDLLRDAFEA